MLMSFWPHFMKVFWLQSLIRKMRCFSVITPSMLFEYVNVNLQHNYLLTFVWYPFPKSEPYALLSDHILYVPGVSCQGNPISVIHMNC